MTTISLLFVVGAGVSGLFALAVAYVVTGEFFIFLRNRARVIQDESSKRDEGFTHGRVIFFHHKGPSGADWAIISKEICPDDYAVTTWAFTLLPTMLSGLAKLTIYHF